MTPDDDEEGMQEALDRARERGGADTFGVVAGLDEPAGEMTLPEVDMSEPAAEPPSPPPPEPLPEPKTTLATFLASGKPDPRARMESIAQRRYEPSAALSDEAIARAGDERKAKTASNDFTRAIQAWMFRKPFEPSAPPDEAGSLLARRRMEQGDFERGQRQELTAAQLAAKAVKGEKVPELTPWQKLQTERQTTQDAERKAAAEDAAKRRDEGSRLSAERFVETKRHNKETEGAQWAAAGRAEKGATEKKTEDVPPEYEIAPGANPGPDSRKKFTALVASQQKLKGLTAKMRKETEGVGRAGRILNYDTLNQLATQIGIEGKNVAELGALSGPDMDLMNAMVQNPTSAWNIFRDSDIGRNMAGLDSWADESVRAGEKAYGLRKRAGAGGDDPLVTLIAKDGRRKLVKKSAADEFLRTNPGEATIGE